MKIFIKSSILLALATIISCKKETKKDVITNEVKVVTTIDSNGVKKQDSTVIFNRNIDGKSIVTKEEIKKYVYQYEAFDGTKAEVTFTHYPEKSYILIERNKLKIELPQTKADEKSATFEKDGIKAVTEGQKLTITQNGETFELVKN
ncbi:hypothetical protein GCM10010992_09220 [Cloacibacterium rupense]|uniref:Uncharacterized protein n=1 Tax=Cloacibacterium rupense TaxID=517423 RepID=A0ABQ2NHV5_9FLAO|nr:hypothetical protein [Cloacibacterium rupense]GGP02914.1 hypothetical protein GCM10010992_09220 [Cloacibacterium rupense]